MQCGIINLGKRNSYLVHSRALQCNINCYKESSSSECQPIRWWSEMNFNHLRQDAATTGPWRNEPLAGLPRVQSGEQVQADVNSPSPGPGAAKSTQSPRSHHGFYPIPANRLGGLSTPGEGNSMLKKDLMQTPLIQKYSALGLSHRIIRKFQIRVNMSTMYGTSDSPSSIKGIQPFIWNAKI